MTAYELESKIELNQTDFEHLLACGQIRGLIDQLNVYYDCNKGLSNNAATFRVRFTPEAKPMMTLKVPISTEAGTRKSLEVEQAMEGTTQRCLQKQWDVAKDLPQEFVTHLSNLGIGRLERIGWMRNRRWQVEFFDNLIIELDQVKLPNGETFFEVEIESTNQEIHVAALAMIKETTKSSRPSILSKYERFLKAIDEVVLSQH